MATSDKGLIGPSCSQINKLRASQFHPVGVMIAAGLLKRTTKRAAGGMSLFAILGRWGGRGKGSESWQAENQQLQEKAGMWTSSYAG